MIHAGHLHLAIIMTIFSTGCCSEVLNVQSAMVSDNALDPVMQTSQSQSLLPDPILLLFRREKLDEISTRVHNSAILRRRKRFALACWHSCLGPWRKREKFMSAKKKVEEAGKVVLEEHFENKRTAFETSLPDKDEVEDNDDTIPDGIEMEYYNDNENDK